jgi:hypothetical protein
MAHVTNGATSTQGLPQYSWRNRVLRPDRLSSHPPGPIVKAATQVSPSSNPTPRPFPEYPIVQWPGRTIALDGYHCDIEILCD